jgi:uncharacterized membrane protein
LNHARFSYDPTHTSTSSGALSTFDQARIRRPDQYRASLLGLAALALAIPFAVHLAGTAGLLEQYLPGPKLVPGSLALDSAAPLAPGDSAIARADEPPASGAAP